MASDDKAGTVLRSRLHSVQDYDLLDVNIFLSGEPAAEQLDALDSLPGVDDAGPVLNRIREQASANQQGLLDFLETSSGQGGFLDDAVSLPASRAAKSFWITNAVAVEISPPVLEKILKRPDVVHVELARHVDLKELLDAKKVTKAKKKSSAASADRARTARPSVRRRIAPGLDRGVVDAGPTPTWSVKLIKAPLLWQMGLRGEGIVAAIIDTGVNYRHPDLKKRMWKGGTAYPKYGYDFANNDNDPMDDQGHGTSCAGIVAGDGTAGRGTGVAPRASVMAIRVGGQERTFWRGYEFAIERGVQVISSSMSWKYPSQPDYPGWRRICETVLAAGILHANSIGNQGDDLTTYPIPYNIATPGNCPPPRLHPLQLTRGGVSSAISCGATDDADQLAYYSGRGPATWESGPFLDYPWQNGEKMGLIKPDLCAPGPGTTSCNYKHPDTTGARPYSSFGGTSAATPHLGGCLVLLAQACKKADKPIVPAQVQEALENTAARIVGQTRNKEDHYGAGRIDVYAAYKYGKQKGWW